MSGGIRVLYDDGGFVMPYGGVARYLTEMIKRLPDDISWQFGMVSTRNIYLQKPPYCIPQHKQNVHDFIRDTLKGHSFPGVTHLYKMLARLMPRKFPSGELANDRFFRETLIKGDFDILHLTSAHPVHENWRPVLGKRPIVVTIYDLIPELIYGGKRVSRTRRRLLRDATQIIAISEYTKHDIMRIYGVPSEKISVIHLGFLKPDVLAPVLFPLPKPYLLYVGARGGYKNFSFFVEAIAPILKTSELSLLCTGGRFNADELAQFDRLGISDKIHQHFVADAEMTDLFANAVAFVYPSIYEGFGIPILDAFAAGCPVLISDASCFPEVAGDAALYFDPKSAGDMRKKLTELLEGDIRKSLVDKGRERVQQFSWQRCADQTAEVYRKAALKIK